MAEERSRGRFALGAGLVWIAALTIVAVLRDDRTTSAPAVVALVVWDSVALDRLGVYGEARGTTPTLDLLAAGALVHDEHVACVDTTAASIASLLTGLRPRHHGLGRISTFGRCRLPESIPTLAERFREAGWTTIASVSLPHLAGGSSGLARGFDVYEGPPDEPVRAVRPAAETLAAVRHQLDLALTRGERVFLFVHFADVRALELADAPGAGRFLPRLAESFAAQDPALAEELARAALYPIELEQLVAKYARRRGDPLRAALDVAFYDAAVARMDDALAELLGVIARGGRRACVALTGGRAGGALFGGSDEVSIPDRRLRSPFVLRLPVDGYAGRSSVPTQDLDVAPTLASLAGLAPLERCDGGDLSRPLFAGESLDPARVALVERGDFTLRTAVGERHVLAIDRELVEQFIERAPGDEPAPDERARLRAALDGFDALGVCRVSSFDADGAPLVSTLHRGRGIERGALELVLARAAARGGALEEQVWIGGRALAELDLPVFQRGAQPWPLDADGEPKPAAVRVVERSGGWSTVIVGSPADGAAEVVIEWSPVDPSLGLELVRASETVQITPHPRRAGAVVVSGATPLELEVKRRPSGRFALACSLSSSGRVFVEQMRVEPQEPGEWLRFAGPDEVELLVSPGAWDDPALYTPAPAALAAGVLIELLDPAPPGPPDPALDERELLRRKQLSTTD